MLLQDCFTCPYDEIYVKTFIAEWNKNMAIGEISDCYDGRILLVDKTPLKKQNFLRENRKIHVKIKLRLVLNGLELLQDWFFL